MSKQLDLFKDTPGIRSGNGYNPDDSWYEKAIGEYKASLNGEKKDPWHDLGPQWRRATRKV